MPRTFNEDVLLMLLDKGLLAFILLATGLVINRSLERYKTLQARETERYKTVQARETELVKAELQAMTATWAGVFSWRDATTGKLGVSKVLSNDEWNALKLEIEGSFHKLMTEMAAHRPLCGRAFADAAALHAAKLMQFHCDYSFQRKWDFESAFAKLTEEANQLADIRSHFEKQLEK